jgi:uncharacterized protein (DUF983 family)
MNMALFYVVGALIVGAIILTSPVTGSLCVGFAAVLLYGFHLPPWAAFAIGLPVTFLVAHVRHQILCASGKYQFPIR